MMESKAIWMNGELVPFREAKIHFLTPAHAHESTVVRSNTVGEGAGRKTGGAPLVVRMNTPSSTST